MEARTDLPRLDTPTTLSESALDVLRERVLQGHFQPGERLVEAELARQLGTSRGPVREALKQLKSEGLVQDAPRRGSFVAELTDADVRELYELRAALEARAARLLVERGDEAAFERLAEVLEEMRRSAAARDRARFAHFDALFHDELCRLSGNRHLHRVFNQHARLLWTLLRLAVTTQYETLDWLLAEHEHLYSEIASRDVARAEAACSRHLEQATEEILEMRSAAPR